MAAEALRTETQPQNPKLQVFLSHLTIESKFADTLKEHLIQDFIGLVEVFVASDATTVPVGSQWLDELVAALERAQLHLVLCSRDSVGRPWIHYEAGAARVRGIPTVPLCHSGLTPAQLPVPLSESEGLILTDPAGVRRLYETIARLLGSNVPSVDFAAYGQAFQSLERDYALHRREDGFIGDAKPRKRFVPKPRVLCVTSAQFKEIGFGNQLQIVLDAFPHNLKHDVVTSSAELTDLLSKEHVDILHIAAYVCPRGGDIYFSKVDLPSGASAVPEAEIDKIHPDALATLLRLSQTILLVVGSCESLALATAMLTETDVIAPRDMVSAKAMATWVETFYSTLKTQPLAEAVSLATQMSRAPMKLYARQQSIPDVFFGKEADERAGVDSDRRQAAVAGP